MRNRVLKELYNLRLTYNYLIYYIISFHCIYIGYIYRAAVILFINLQLILIIKQVYKMYQI